MAQSTNRSQLDVDEHVPGVAEVAGGHSLHNPPHLSYRNAARLSRPSLIKHKAPFWGRNGAS